MKKKITSIVIGIRHRRAFRIPEIAGDIVDHIAHDSSSPFHMDKFDKTDIIVNGVENKGRVLVGEDGLNSLAIDIDSVVLTLKSSDISSTIEEIEKDYLPYISKNIFNAYGIENINRIGVVFVFEDTDVKDANALLAKCTDNTYSEPDHFMIRFDQKDVAMGSLVKKDILDYANEIISFQKGESGVQAKFDYQFYYSPEIKSISDVDFSTFLKTASEKLDSRFFSWLKTNYEKA